MWVRRTRGCCPHPALRATFSRRREKGRPARLAEAASACSGREVAQDAATAGRCRSGPRLPIRPGARRRSVRLAQPPKSTRPNPSTPVHASRSMRPGHEPRSMNPGPPRPIQVRPGQARRRHKVLSGPVSGHAASRSGGRAKPGRPDRQASPGSPPSRPPRRSQRCRRPGRALKAGAHRTRCVRRDSRTRPCPRPGRSGGTAHRARRWRRARRRASRRCRR